MSRNINSSTALIDAKNDFYKTLTKEYLYFVLGYSMITNPYLRLQNLSINCTPTKFPLGREIYDKIMGSLSLASEHSLDRKIAKFNAIYRNNTSYMNPYITHPEVKKTYKLFIHRLEEYFFPLLGTNVITTRDGITLLNDQPIREFNQYIDRTKYHPAIDLLINCHLTLFSYPIVLSLINRSDSFPPDFTNNASTTKNDCTCTDLLDSMLQDIDCFWETIYLTIRKDATQIKAILGADSLYWRYINILNDNNESLSDIYKHLLNIILSPELYQILLAINSHPQNDTARKMLFEVSWNTKFNIHCFQKHFYSAFVKEHDFTSAISESILKNAFADYSQKIAIYNKAESTLTNYIIHDSDLYKFNQEAFFSYKTLNSISTYFTLLKLICQEPDE